MGLITGRPPPRLCKRGLCPCGRRKPDQHGLLTQLDLDFGSAGLLCRSNDAGNVSLGDGGRTAAHSIPFPPIKPSSDWPMGFAIVQTAAFMPEALRRRSVLDRSINPSRFSSVTRGRTANGEASSCAATWSAVSPSEARAMQASARARKVLARGQTSPQRPPERIPTPYSRVLPDRPALCGPTTAPDASRRVASPTAASCRHRLLQMIRGAATWHSRLRAAIDLGVQHVRGVDGRIDDGLLVDHALTEQRDLTARFNLGEQFEVALCLEVGEHLPADAAPQLIASLIAHSVQSCSAPLVPIKQVSIISTASGRPTGSNYSTALALRVTTV